MQTLDPELSDPANVKAGCKMSCGRRRWLAEVLQRRRLRDFERVGAYLQSFAFLGQLLGFTLLHGMASFTLFSTVGRSCTHDVRCESSSLTKGAPSCIGGLEAPAMVKLAFAPDFPPDSGYTHARGSNELSTEPFGQKGVPARPGDSCWAFLTAWQHADASRTVVSTLCTYRQGNQTTAQQHPVRRSSTRPSTRICHSNLPRRCFRLNYTS